MPFWPKILLLLAFLVPAIAEPEATPPSVDVKPEPSAEAKASPNLDLVIPPNQPVKGMHLPFYNLDGSLKMQFDAIGANRVDEQNIEMQKLRIETFNERHKSEMVVDLPTAKFSLTTQIISSPDLVHVRRPDFLISGKGMEFDTKNKTGRLFSHIRMEIHSRDEINPQPAPTPNGP